MKNIKKQGRRRKTRRVSRVNSGERALRQFAMALPRQKNEVQLQRDLQRCVQGLGFNYCRLYVIKGPLGDLCEVISSDADVLKSEDQSARASYHLALLSLTNGKSMVSQAKICAIPLTESERPLGVFCCFDSNGIAAGEHTQGILESLGQMCVLQLNLFLTNAKYRSHISLFETELASRQSNLEKTLRALETAKSELRTFESSAQKALRKPIDAIGEYLELIWRNEDQLCPSSVSFLESAEKRTTNLRLLLDGMTWYHKMQDMVCPDLTVELNQVLSMACFNLSNQIKKQNARLDWSDPTPCLKGNELYLVQLFQNLISNSLKFCSDECQPEISIQWQRENDRWKFIYTDNGPGIAEQERDCVFELFYRGGNDQKKVQGLGMGLPVSRRIVSIHGGEMILEEGPGCIFSFSLPAATD